MDLVCSQHGPFAGALLLRNIVSTFKTGNSRCCTIAQVPKDAHFMDMVFSNTGDLQGGFYDNNGGLDYHVPVTGGVGDAVRLNVVHVSVEMAPVAKVSLVTPRLSGWNLQGATCFLQVCPAVCHKRGLPRQGAPNTIYLHLPDCHT